MANTSKLTQKAIIVGISSAALTISGSVETRAQVACVVGANANACIVAQGVTIAGQVNTNGNGSTVDNMGTVDNRIQTISNNSSVTNSGSVGTRIRTSGGISGVTNSGTVGSRIETNGGISGVTNSGSVGTRIRTFGIFSDVTNSGTVGTRIRTSGAFSGVTNSGTVGTNIQTSGGSSGITNSGTVGGFVEISGTFPTLTLLAGSRIFGTIDLSGVGTSTLNVGNGLNLMATFITPPTVINSNGQPFVLLGNQVAVLDPTAFSLQDEMLADLTGGIFSGLYARLAGIGGGTGGGNGAVTNGFASLSGLGQLNLGNSTNIVPTAGGVSTSGPQQGFWMQSIFGYRNTEPNGISNGGDSSNVGAMAGIDAWLSEGMLAGVFGGYNHSELQTAFKAQKIETDSYFGGAYVHFQQDNWFANLMVSAGVSDNDSNRQVATNNLAGGVQSAKADYDGTFVSPEVSVGTTIDLGGLKIQPSARLRYARIWLDKFSESGSASNLTIKKRNVSLFLGRAQIAVPIIANLTPRIGVEAWTADNNKVSGTMLGQNISFNPGGRDSEVSFFAGATVAGKLTANVSAFIDGEFHINTRNGSRAQGSAGLTVHF